MKTLREIETGKTFKAAGIEFIKVKETNKGTFAVTKDCLFDSAYLTYKPPLEDRPYVMSRLLASHNIKFVEDECEDLIDELQNLVFDEKSDRTIPLDDGSMQIDTWDSWTYSISNNWSYLDI